MLTEIARGWLVRGLRAAAGVLGRTANRFAVEEGKPGDWAGAFGRHELTPRARELLERRPAPYLGHAPERAGTPLAGSAAARAAAARRA